MDESKAKSKLKNKNLDAVFLNRIDAMGADQNAGVALAAGGVRRAFKRMDKADLAEKFWEWIVTLN